MFLNSVKPWLATMSDSVLHSVTLRVTGVGESHLESRIGHLLENANPTAAVYAKTAEVVIRITAKAASENEAGACVWTMRSIFTISWAIASMPWTRIRWRKWW